MVKMLTLSFRRKLPDRSRFAMMKQLLTIALILTALNTVKAQQCLDTLGFYPQPATLCYGLGFEPVCGCNGETYFNYCFATVQDGVLQYSDGPCGTLAAFSSPNPLLDVINFQVVNRLEDDIIVEIKDMNGTVFLFNKYSRTGYLDIRNVYISDFPRGMYFITVYNSQELVVQKVMKWDYR